MDRGATNTQRAPSECAHYWQLTDDDDVRTSSGTCAKCGKQRQFQNFVSTESEQRGRSPAGAGQPPSEKGQHPETSEIPEAVEIQ